MRYHSDFPELTLSLEAFKPVAGKMRLYGNAIKSVEKAVSDAGDTVSNIAAPIVKPIEKGLGEVGRFSRSITDPIINSNPITAGASNLVYDTGKTVANSPLLQAGLAAGGGFFGVNPAFTASLLAANSGTQREGNNLRDAALAGGIGYLGGNAGQYLAGKPSTLFGPGMGQEMAYAGGSPGAAAAGAETAAGAGTAAGTTGTAAGAAGAAGATAGTAAGAKSFKDFLQTPAGIATGLSALGGLANASGGTPESPNMPDYMRLADMQAKSALEAQRVATRANRVNQNNPFGSVSWTETAPDTWEQTTTLNPQDQAFLDASRQTSGKAFDAFKGFLENPESGLPQRAINVGQTAQDAIMSRLNPQLTQQEEALRTRLANQGINQGSEAYARELASFGQNRNDLMTQAALQGIGLDQSNRANAFGEQNQLFNMIQALRSGSQSMMPQFSDYSKQAGTQGTSYLSAADAQYGNQVDAANAANARRTNQTAGLFGLAGIGLGSNYGKNSADIRAGYDIGRGLGGLFG